MGRAWVVAVLATGCLQSPPASVPKDGGGTGDDAAPSDALQFPPEGAEVTIEATLPADVDSDGLEDLVLLDSNIADDWAGLYILRAGPDGWTGIDEVMLDFQPSAVRFARLLRAGGPALAVGGKNGEITLVDYKAIGDYELVNLEITNPVDAILTIHSGLFDDLDTRASLLVYDGTDVFLSSPIDEEGQMTLTRLDIGSVFDAVFWPIDSTGQASYIAARGEDNVAWFDTGGVHAMPEETAVASRFGHLVSGECGTHLVVGGDQSLWIGSVTCDGASSAIGPLDGDTLDTIDAMAVGDLGGSQKHDVALIGTAGGDLVAQALLDITAATGSYSADSVTVTLPLTGGFFGNLFLTPTDAQGDGSALLYAVTTSGQMVCGAVEDSQAAPCPGRWQVKAR